MGWGCEYEFWPQGAGDNKLFVDPVTFTIGYDWDVGATVQTDLKMLVPKDWRERPIIAISWDAECQETGYRYKNYWEMKEDIDDGKIKGKEGALSTLEKIWFVGDSESSAGMGGDEENIGKRIKPWMYIVAGLIVYKIVKD